MAYSAEISRNNPTCFLFMIDQSTSMLEPLGGQEGIEKARFVADALNKTLSNLVIDSSRVTGSEQEIRDYFSVGVIGYGLKIGSAFAGNLADNLLVPISEIGYHPARVDIRTKKIPDGAGGIVEEEINFPIWIDPVANGMTPMCQALELAYTTLQDWIALHPDSFPPIVLNMTDGAANDGDPTAIASHLRSLATSDGNVLLFNLHASGYKAAPIQYPNSTDALPQDQLAHLLFSMSSPLPDAMLEMAMSMYPAQSGARGFVFNADIQDVTSFFSIGTRHVAKHLKD
jgi:hypothetical protein